MRYLACCAAGCLAITLAANAAHAQTQSAKSPNAGRARSIPIGSGSGRAGGYSVEVPTKFGFGDSGIPVVENPGFDQIIREQATKAEAVEIGREGSHERPPHNASPVAAVRHPTPESPIEPIDEPAQNAVTDRTDGDINSEPEPDRAAAPGSDPEGGDGDGDESDGERAFPWWMWLVVSLVVTGALGKIFE